MAISSGELISAIRPVLTELAADLLERSHDRRLNSALTAAWRRERSEERTADPFEVWARNRVGQVAAAWVLSVLFARVLEVRGLLDRNRIAGDGARDSQDQFVRLAPFLTARDYLLTVFRELSALEGARHLFAPGMNPLWLLGPSGEAAQRLIDAFRAGNDDGSLKIDLAGADPRLLGDLYQDLDAEVRERYALLQTPKFVEDLILDETLEPAIGERGVAEVRLLDPTCGSGHFLLGAYQRLLSAWRRKEPAAEPRELARRALDQVAGIDVNPYAVAITRFRLTLAYLEAAGHLRLAGAPPLPIRVAVADSLLQLTRLTLPGMEEPTAFELEDRDLALELLREGTWPVVVGNPPYINPKDAALRSAYRKTYRACYRGYQLVAPFLERFFQLADRPAEGLRGGHVGAIVGNGFMKREFGRKLIEEVLPEQELTQVIDTSGAYIPGHGTPTVILFGRRWANPLQPSKNPVLAVMGKRGEPTTPDDPANGQVWSSIRDHLHDVGYEDEFISVTEVERARFGIHPWSLGGGGAAELKQRLEKNASCTLADLEVDIGRTLHTGDDHAFFMPSRVARRIARAPERFVLLVKGEQVRDWSISEDEVALFPYTRDNLIDPSLGPSDSDYRHYWSLRTALGWRKDYGERITDRGLQWFEYSMFFRERFRTPLSIAFAFVATHNHFVLDRGGKVFNRSAPIIKLPAKATEDDHLALLGYLNSSTACFWMKQVFHPKSSASQRHHPDPTRYAYEFAGTGLMSIPLPAKEALTSFVPLAREMDRLAAERGNTLSIDYARENAKDWSSSSDVVTFLQSRWIESDGVRERLILLQEELDWMTYLTFHLVASNDLLLDQELLDSVRLPRGHRPFERNREKVSSVRRHGVMLSTGDAEVHSETEFDDRLEPVWIARYDAIRSSSPLSLIETPVFKRLWRDTEQNIPENQYRQDLDRKHLRNLLLSRFEQIVTGDDPENQQPTTTRQIADRLQNAPGVNAVAEVLTGETSPNLERLFTELVGSEAVPYLAAYRYSDSGMEKRAAWEATWALQRREDTGEEVEVPVPPRYATKDFRSPVYWRHRGKLDVPKERFIAYPDAISEDDGDTVLVGWAGWDHRQQATALAELYQRRKRQDGWDAERLAPLLAGIDEWVPWLRQWHNDPDPRFGRIGEQFAAFVESEARSLGLTRDELRAWRPAKRTRNRKRATNEAASGKPRGRKPTLEPDALLAAVAELANEGDSGQGVEQRQLAESLGVSGPTVARIAGTLVEEGRLQVVSSRPRRFKLPEPGP